MDGTDMSTTDAISVQVVAILAAHVEGAEDVVGDAPDEGDDFIVGGVIH